MQRFFALLFTLLIPFLVYGFIVPEKPQNFVSDFASILPNSEKIQLEEKISNFEKTTSNEVAVVLIKRLDGDSIENIAQQIFDKWGIGKADKDNGVLVLVSIEDRKMRIQTGYGVEGDLTDLETRYIQDEMMAPSFRQGKYFEGLMLAVDSIISSLNNGEIIPENYNKTENKKNLSWDLILFLIFVVFQWIISVLARSKSFWAGGVLGGVGSLVVYYFFLNSIFIFIPVFLGLVGLGTLFDFLVSRAYQNHKNGGGKNPPWFMGGGFGGRSGGGGFSGFGGGSSGGGGSSSGW